MDLQKRNEMSLNEKRELVYEVSRFPQGAAEILQCWTRRDLLELICAELGKERKYTNVPKSKMIAYLLKLVSRRKVELKNDKSVALLLGQNNHNEMQKKANGEQPHHVTKSVNSDLSLCREVRAGSSLICRNIACQATLNEGDAYCKRCSCCICHKYDENKDPSLWNLRKQLEIARQARRVDVLCERLSLSHKMLKGSEHYKELSNIISSAVKILAKEVGSALDQVSAIIGRTLANRLTCAADVQKLCLSALEIVASTVASTSVLEANNNLEPLGYQPQILFEEITPFSLVIVLKYQDNIYKEDIDGCRVWHRNAKVLNYPVEPTCHILRPNTRNLVSGLSPSTEYFFKVLPFGSTLRFGECEAKCSTRSLDRGSSQCSTQNSESLCIKEDVLRYQKNELNLQKQERVIQYDSPKASTNSSENNESPDRYYKRTKIARLDGTSDNDESQLPPTSEVLPLAGSNSSPSEAPNKPDWLSSTPDSACKNYVEQQYEYCVKVIKWLEHGGHMDKEFRVKFLTWFSLKSSAKDRRVVSAFVHALISDPANLVAQLMDAFMDVVCSKEKPAQSKFPCYKLWH
ncbi:VIN3-like protein 2 isoform X2 [Brachypodium distachyon]|uniref:VIN3-like protein 2 isoform X2 n=1 Tax=Brachypodium distachyon TaxID=15368 RepID=UPI000D0C9BA1|nr:VIN3-like protein 2 isoform X2 [Brachypodium distachyon]|eukprot:XP_024317690.1 VIN3-like protein 2 isoform X2 [Brachypodium distachyon]